MDKIETNKKFGEFIKALRRQNGLTQVDLSIKIQNNFQNISSLERGAFSPSLHYLTNLAKAFNISLSELISSFERFVKEGKL